MNQELVAKSKGSGGSARLRVKVKPRSSVEGVGSLDDGTLIVRVSAPPVDGRANRAVCELVASLLGLSRSRVRIEAGEKSREKTVLVDGLSQAEAECMIAKLRGG